jgi:hypothetical protein
MLQLKQYGEQLLRTVAVVVQARQRSGGGRPGVVLSNQGACRSR